MCETPPVRIVSVPTPIEYLEEGARLMQAIQNGYIPPRRKDPPPDQIRIVSIPCPPGLLEAGRKIQLQQLAEYQEEQARKQQVSPNILRRLCQRLPRLLRQKD